MSTFVRNCLIMSIDRGRPSPLWVVPFRRQKFLDCIRVEKLNWTQATKQAIEHAFIHFSLVFIPVPVMWLAAFSLSWLPEMTSRNKALCLLVVFILVFCHNNKSETRSIGWGWITRVYFVYLVSLGFGFFGLVWFDLVWFGGFVFCSLETGSHYAVLTGLGHPM